MAKDIQPKIVLAYADEYGNEPFTKWLESLKDRKTAKIYWKDYKDNG